MRIKPDVGLSNSSIKKMPPATAIAQSSNATIAVRFDGANSPKLAKRMQSQKISKTRKGMGMLCPVRCSSDHREQKRKAATRLSFEG